MSPQFPTLGIYIPMIDSEIVHAVARITDHFAISFYVLGVAITSILIA